MSAPVGPTSAELRRRALDELYRLELEVEAEPELAETWRDRAAHADDAAAAFRADGDSRFAEELEQVAVDYRAAADERGELELEECSECGHLHLDPVTRRYERCPLASSGCTCPHSPRLYRTVPA